MYSVSVFGLGFVGGSMLKSFQMKGVNAKGYDKFKEGCETAAETFWESIKKI